MKSSKQEFVQLTEEHQALLFKVCNVYADTTEDRQDLFQDIILQLWKSYPNFRGKSKVSTWIYRVAINTAISTLRKAKPATTAIGRTTPELANSSETEFENQNLLRELIKSLTKVEKSLILLYLDEKSYEEIAEITGMTKSNVSVRLVRIRKKLAEIYKTEKV